MAAKKKTKKSKSATTQKTKPRPAGAKKAKKNAKKKAKKTATKAKPAKKKKKTPAAQPSTKRLRLTGAGAGSLTLVARCSTLDGEPYTPTVADELAYWNDFKAIVEDYATCEVGDDPANWSASVHKHIQDVIAPKLSEDDLTYDSANGKFSRQTNSGWDDTYNGAANCSVYRGSSELFSMGCEGA